MKTLLSQSAVAVIGTITLAGSALADRPAKQSVQPEQQVEERLVFVTGSLIPHRIQVRTIGTTTVSPLRVIDRREMDQNGRYTTPGAFVNEPAVRVLGH
jgi:hypothetical protein